MGGGGEEAAMGYKLFLSWTSVIKKIEPSVKRTMLGALVDLFRMAKNFACQHTYPCFILRI